MAGRTRNGSKGWTPTPLPLASLAEELSKRIPQPVDPLEVAAVLESMGITDDVAYEDYGAADVFALAAAIFPVVQAVPARREIDGASDEVLESRRAKQAAHERALAVLVLSLSPLALVLLIGGAVAGTGREDAPAAAALWGVSVGMLLVAGPVFAVGRRSSILAGLGYVAEQRLYLRRRALRGLAIIALSLVSFCVAGGAAELPVGVIVAFGASAAGLGAGWMLVNTLLFAGRPRFVGACAAAGTAGGGIAAGAASPLLGLCVGSAAALVLLLVGVVALGRGADSPARSPGGVLHALESLPYGLYALAVIALMIAPATLAWLQSGGASARAEAAGDVGRAFTAAILPTAIALTFTEHLLRGYWTFVRRAGEHASGREFADTIRRFDAGRILRYAVLHAALSGVAAVVFLLLTLWTALEEAIDTGSFLAGLGFYLLVASSQFTGSLLVNFSRPWRATAPFAAALLFGAAAAAVGGLAGSPASVPAISLGAAAIGLTVAVWNWNAAAEDLPYTYSTAF